MLLAIDRLALGQELRYDVAAACEGTGLPEEELRHIWRSLGFPDPQPGEPVFSDVDLGNLAAVADLMHSGVVSPEVTYGMTRVIGSSMARIASALIDAVSAQSEQSELAGRRGEEVAEVLEPVASEAGGFLPMFPAVLEQVWRRHLQVAARRRLLRGDVDDGPGQVVGFADLVGFTALAQQVTDEELAEVVDQFERLAYDVVVAGGGRVVKMIGDEVMFLVDDPVFAAEIALGLAEASRDAAELSDVRVGLAARPGDRAGGRRLRRHGQPGQPGHGDRLPRHGRGVARAARAPRGRIPSSPSAACGRASSSTSAGCRCRCSGAPTTRRPRSARRSTSAAS